MKREGFAGKLKSFVKSSGSDREISCRAREKEKSSCEMGNGGGREDCVVGVH